uniref:ANK_REP_REGION domain-containing protein n=1 Tax=Heterorhabditis bacteriophora TaxID=37862 RepID=A0A1I7X5W6_HETBA
MTEKVIYKQCERDAKSTVSLAKCAVGLFDARDTERKQNGLEDKAEKYANMVKINITRKQSEEFLNHGEKKKHKDSIGIIYKTDNIYNSQIDIFVDKFGKKFGSTLKYGNKNPIRPQLRRRQKRSKDRIRDAFELFLAEERMKKKISNQRIARKLNKSNVTKEKIAKSREIYSIAFSITKTSDKDKQLITPDKNVLGISRLYNKKSKRKRKIDSAGAYNTLIYYGDFKFLKIRFFKAVVILLELSKSRPAIDFPKIAAKYFSRMLGGATVQRSHLDNLRKIRDHYNRAEKCRAYFKLMNDENRRLFESLSLSIDSRTPEVNNNASSVLEQIVQMINSFAVSYNPLNKMSIMSPRLFSLFPDISKPSSNRLLSPTVLSFQDDGYFSLPELFDIITKNQQYQNLMLEVIMDMSGAGQVLENLLSQMSTEIKNFEEVQYPLVEEMSKKDHSFIKALNSFNDEQSMDYDNKGYAFLNEDQIKLIYGDNHEYHGINVNITELNKMTKEEKEQRIEEDIRQLAAIGRPKWPFWNDDFQISRYRRSNVESGQVVNGVNFETLAPYAFTNMVGQGAALEVVTLSPHAFIGEILFPEALTVSVNSGKLRYFRKITNFTSCQ